MNTKTTSPSNTATIFKCAVLVLGCIIIPLIYSYFYLGAFWDPYSKLDQMPVAVVNQDKGAQINGKDRNLGSEMVDRLKKDNTLKWIFTDEDDAASGIKYKKYYAMITLPENFSKNIASAETTDKKTANIYYETNEKRNFLASQILNRAVVVLEEEARSNVDKELTLQLTDKLKQVPSKLNDLDSGIRKLQDGSNTLKDGAATLANGQNDLTNGVSGLHTGIGKLKDGSTALRSNLFTLDNGLGQLLAGVKKLGAGTAQIPILQKGVNDLDNGAKALSGGLKQAADGSGKLSQGAANLPALIKGINDLDSGANALSGGLTLAVGGASQLSEGAKNITALNGGIDQLNGGATQLKTGVNNYVSGVNQLIGQNKQLAASLQTICTSTAMTDSQKVQSVAALLSAMSKNSAQLELLSKGGDGVNAGADGLAAGTTQLASYKDSLTLLQNGITALSKSLTDIQKGAGQVAAGADTLKANSDKLTELQQGVDSLNKALSQLEAGANTLSDGTGKLKSGTAGLGQFTGGAASMNQAVGKLKDGSSKLYDGSQQLESNLMIADNASEKLLNGAIQLNNGANSLKDGTIQMASGITTAKNGVNTAITKANDELKSADGLDKFAGEPVSVKTTNLYPVPNYGTAFAPYFLSLSLWVGALIMLIGIYLDPDERIKTLSRSSDRRFLRIGIFFLIGLAQAVVLALVIQFALGLEIKNVFGYYLSCMLVSVVFTSIVEFLIVKLGVVGKFLSIVLLILQLTSCGGTFPMEIVPKLFNVLYPFMPMTYSVNLFKEVISGATGNYIFQNVYILLGIMALFTILTALFSITHKVKDKVIEKIAEDNA